MSIEKSGGSRLRTALAASVAATALVAATGAAAKIVRLEVTTVESPTFEGTAFGDAGQYEKLVGIAYGAVDPTDPLNGIIADIEFAPTNADGMVEYAAEVFILRPIDPALGNHRIFFDLNNRGGMRAMRLNDSNAGYPTTAEDAGKASS
jgi:hypothetical protein